jgi:ribosomal-protein-alanine N-acetyltransferase
VERARLVVFSVAALDAEESSVGALCALLGAAQPVEWPPPFSDSGVLDWFRQQLLADQTLAPWLGHYIVSRIDDQDTLVGTAGYKGPPDPSGMVEIGYSIVPAYHRMGIGTAAVEMLVVQAFADSRVQRVMAETPLDFLASRRLLEKCGFRQVGQRVDPEDGDLALYEIGRT